MQRSRTSLERIDAQAPYIYYFGKKGPEGCVNLWVGVIILVPCNKIMQDIIFNSLLKVEGFRVQT